MPGIAPGLSIIEPLALAKRNPSPKSDPATATGPTRSCRARGRLGPPGRRCSLALPLALTLPSLSRFAPTRHLHLAGLLILDTQTDNQVSAPCPLALFSLL